MPIRDWGQALNQFAIEFGKDLAQRHFVKIAFVEAFFCFLEPIRFFV
jgi:hypothetical protein